MLITFQNNDGQTMTNEKENSDLDDGLLTSFSDQELMDYSKAFLNNRRKFFTKLAENNVEIKKLMTLYPF